MELPFPALHQEKRARTGRRTRSKPNCSSLQLQKSAGTTKLNIGAALVSCAGYVTEVPSDMAVLVFPGPFRFPCAQLHMCCVCPKSRTNFSNSGHGARIQHLTCSSILTKKMFGVTGGFNLKP